MDRRAPWPAAAVVVAVLLLSGCAAPAAAPRTAQPERPTSTPTPLDTPPAEPGEVARATLADGVLQNGSGALPPTGQVAVEVACSGVDGSVVTWRLESGDGAPLGLSGEADCTAPPTTSWLGITADPRPSRVRIVLAADADVVAGWAVVRTGTP